MKCLAFSLSACLIAVLVSNAAEARPTIWEQYRQDYQEEIRRDRRIRSRRRILGTANRLSDRIESPLLRELIMSNSYRLVDDVDAWY